MNPIDFVVRDSAGALQRGVVGDDGTTSIQAGIGQEISLNLRQPDIDASTRTGDDLTLVLADGRVIVIEDYFNDSGAPNRLFISSDGYLNEVAFVETTDGELFAQFGPTEQWGKWSPSDDLIFLGRTDIAMAAPADDEVSMLGATLLGGSGLLGAAGAGAAVVGGAVIAGGGGGGGGAGPAVPTVDNPDLNATVGGDDTSGHVITVTGTGEPGDTVDVTVGSSTVSTVIEDDGTWGVTLEDDTFPDDGLLDTVVTVTHPNGTTTILDGPTYDVDTTPPTISITDGGVVNGTIMDGGVEISGTGEAGATLDITVQGVTQSTTIADDGTWSVIYDDGTLQDGEYTTDITIVATDDMGNSATVTAPLVVDTVAPAITLTDGGIVSGAAMAGGVVLTGTGEAGAALDVTIQGVTQSTTVGQDGTWTVAYPAGSLQEGEYTADVALTSTDAAGNVGTQTGTLVVDTVPPAVTITQNGTINAGQMAGGVVIAGTGEPGATLDVVIQGVTRSATIGQDGTWSVTYQAGTLQDGEYTSDIAVTAQDAVGNSTAITGSLVVDTVTDVTIATSTVEGDGIINAAERADGVTLTGTAQPGASVEVSFGTGSTTVLADAAGNWSATFAASAIPQGEQDATVTAIATDASGNSATSSGTVRIDTVVDPLDFTSTAGGADAILNADEAAGGLVVTGNAEPGSIVMVDLNGVTVQAAVAQDGTWTASYTASQITQGTYTAVMTATATDAAGNTDTITQDVRVDTDAGTLTISPDPIEGDDIINFVESRDGVVLSGTADPGAIVSVTLGGVTHQVVTGANGVWQSTYTAAEIPEGVYTADITATTTDSAGNTLTRTDSVQVDTRVDNLSVSADVIEGDNMISGAERADGVILTGTTEPGSTVSVSLGGATVQAVVAADGTWTASYPASAIPEGEYTTGVTVTATDAAGNVATVTDTVDVDTLVNTLNQQATIAGDNVVNRAEAQDGISLGGQVEPGSSVVVTFGGQSYAATVNAAGTWAVDIPAAAITPGTYDAPISVMATDAVGNVDTIDSSVAIDTDAPDGPVVESFTRDTTGIRGISTEMAEGDMAVAQVGADGTISDVANTQTDIPALNETDVRFASDVPDGSHLVVTRADAAGNMTGTYVVLDDESANSTVDLGNPALGNYAIEQVELQFAEEANLTINEAQLVALSDTTNTLTIHGGSDDQVTITGATRTGSTTVDGENYAVYSVGNDGTLVIDEDINTVIG